MRHTLLLLSVVSSLTIGAASARPLDVHVHVGRHAGHRGIAAYLVRHGLLSPEQAACALLMPDKLGSRRVEHLSIYQRSGGSCPGVAQRPVFLFDVYVDRVSGVVDTTPASRDELDTVL